MSVTMLNIIGLVINSCAAICLVVFGWPHIKKNKDGALSYGQETQIQTKRQYLALRIGLGAFIAGGCLQIIASLLMNAS
jgi:hypothetical protein